MYMCVCVCVCELMFVCVISTGGFPTFETASLLIKQPIIHPSRGKKKESINYGTKTEELLHEKSLPDWTFPLFFNPYITHHLFILVQFLFIFLLASKLKCRFGMIISR